MGLAICRAWNCGMVSSRCADERDALFSRLLMFEGCWLLLRLLLEADVGKLRMGMRVGMYEMCAVMGCGGRIGGCRSRPDGSLLGRAGGNCCSYVRTLMCGGTGGRPMSPDQFSCSCN